jgi:hypothetical protein
VNYQLPNAHSGPQVIRGNKQAAFRTEKTGAKDRVKTDHHFSVAGFHAVGPFPDSSIAA